VTALYKDVWLLPTRLHFVDAEGYLVLSLLKTLRAEKMNLNIGIELTRMFMKHAW
jgi:hypothetical protein